MGIQFTARESAVLFGLLAEHGSDVILKTDCNGFVMHASPSLAQVGLAPADALIGPHLTDLVAPSHRADVTAGHSAALAGTRAGNWIEFPARSDGGRERWFALQMRGLAPAGGRSEGVLAVMRCIDERRRLEQQLFAAEFTDPLTGLSNRPAFIAMLRHLAQRGAGGSLALFDIDNFKAVNLSRGEAAGDAVLVAFADLLRALMGNRDIISRIGGENLGVLLPEDGVTEAAARCERVLAALARARGAPTASIGVAAIGRSLDETLRRAELAKFFARASGGGRVEVAGGKAVPASFDRLRTSGAGLCLQHRSG
jgi:diguanylate cyclase (GGDEF)-like protein/PAS domain S-box-containing protein